ncbi:MAG: TIGR03960 family B12-binding radical SAM protein [Candidatus Omnitrophota bacterium]
MKNLKQVELTEEMLLSVRKPARYIGQEHNIIKKNWQDTDIKCCICFPDTYEIGMSNQGIKIIYHIINKRQDALCERAFTPWIDMESLMRERSISLFSLENKCPLLVFDIIGFSLPYELCYTNILTMLDLANIPLLSKDRFEKEFPLIIAGGPSAFNPEPMADFIDVFVLGDGEEAVNELLDVYKKHKGARPFIGDDKSILLKELSKLDGVYVPFFYEAAYSDEKGVSLNKKSPEAPDNVKRRIVQNLSPEFVSTKPIVPYIKTVHERITVEIMRGCPYSCRFCQASAIYKPVRVLKPEEVLDITKKCYKSTGYDEISLLSLSSASYPFLKPLLKSLMDEFDHLGVGISLPSLRLEDDLKDLPAFIKSVRKSGLTFAPEAATEKMLNIINKNISLDTLINSVDEAYKLGWRRIKLYFMIGLPGEDEEDIKAIIELADKVALLRKKYAKGPADVSLSIASFIPKPHTAFQWEGMCSTEELKKKQAIVRNMANRKKYIKIKFHDLKTSSLEAVFSRGDRRLSQVLLEVWKRGARLDAWSENFKPDLWDSVFNDLGIDKQSYLNKRNYDFLFAWDHIHCGVGKEKLREEHSRAMGAML